MSRNLLHKSKLEDFKRWCAAHNIATRDPRGVYEVLQVCKEGTKVWMCVYDRLDAPEHYTVDRRMENIVRAFIRSNHPEQGAASPREKSTQALVDLGCIKRAYGFTSATGKLHIWVDRDGKFMVTVGDAIDTQVRCGITKLKEMLSKHE